MTNRSEIELADSDATATEPGEGEGGTTAGVALETPPADGEGSEPEARSVHDLEPGDRASEDGGEEDPPLDAADAEALAAELGESVAEEDGEAPEPADAGPGPGEELSDEELLQGVAALLFASPDPLSSGRLVALLERPSRPRVEAALEALGERLAKAELPYVLRPIAGGWRLLTDPELGDLVARLAKSRRTERISPAALETLSIVAYRQPVTKAEIEAIRGVQVGPILRSLVDRGLARVTGRADQPGAPLQYGTTREFLDRFGLGSLKDLPRDGELSQD